MKRLCSNLECGVLKLEGMYTAKMVLFHQGSTELRRCENCVFFLPVNILTGVTRRLLGPHDTLLCVLITWCQKLRTLLPAAVMAFYQSKPIELFNFKRPKEYPQWICRLSSLWPIHKSRKLSNILLCTLWVQRLMTFPVI